MAIKGRQSSTAVKRQSTSSAGGAAKKRRTVLQQCSVVSKAVLTSEDFPQKVLKMIGGHFEHCLAVPKEERHDYQEQVIKMAGEVLDGAQTKINAKVDAAQEKLNSAGAVKSTRDEASVKAAVEVTATVEAFEAAKAAHIDSTSKARAAKNEVSQAVHAQDENNYRLEEARSNTATIKDLVDGTYTPLKDGNVEADSSLMKKITQLGKKCDVESDVMQCLGKTLKTPPGTRGTFDATVLSNFEGKIKTTTEEFEAKIAELEAAKPGLEAKVTEVTDAFEKARAEQESCLNTMESNKGELKDAKQAHSAATRSVVEFGAEMKQTEEELASAKATLQGFVDGPLATYKELCDLTNAEPPAPAAAPEAEA